MDILSILGLVLAVLLMLFGVTFSDDLGFVFGNLANFVNYPSLAITVGGTFAVLMISYSLSNFKNIPSHMKIIFVPFKYDQMSYIASIVEFAKEADRKSVV